MPSAAAITRSRGVVMNPRTSSAFAPTKMVVIVIAAFSLLGDWRTLSERMAWIPAIRITKLTTIAITGRRMKRSVNFISLPFGESVVRRLGSQLGSGSELVVHRHRHTVAQFERAGADHGFAWGHPGDDRDEIPASLAESNELLVRDQGGLTARILLFLDRKNRVSVRREDHSRRRDQGHGLFVVRKHLDIHEHPRRQPPVGVFEDTANPDVTSCDVDLGIDH